MDNLTISLDRMVSGVTVESRPGTHGDPEPSLAWLLERQHLLVPPLTLNMLTLLRSASFQDLVSAIESSRPKLPGTVEILLYQSWLEAVGPAHLQSFAAWYNLGATLAREGDRALAAQAYRNALVAKPDFHPASINLGLSLEALGQPEDALATWQNALQPDEVRAALLNQRGRLLEQLGRLDEAEIVLRKSLLTDPKATDAIQHWVHIRQKICLWPVLLPLPGLSADELMRTSGPLGVLALTDDAHRQLQTTTAWIQRKTTAAPMRLSPAQGYRHGRIRIGYLSSDFCRHAMSFLIAELFERHDRARFEVFGYCSSPEDGSAIRARVMQAFDHCRIVRHLDDEAAARLIRHDEIDILIDLNGLTAGSRVQILRWKPAPLQATYLGFIGPVPLPELDFLLCDDFVIPPAQADVYQPTPLAISSIYQANDSKRLIGCSLTRGDVDLPADRFVFCCFSNHYKITQEMFSAWLSILQRVPNGVLWLSVDNRWSAANLTAAALHRGLTADRLIFAPRTDPDTYMSRLALADLFLDTFPYNAGTIASDAIRMQLPLLTLCGRSFASRMAGSLLRAIGAADGITNTLEAYVAAAVRLASDPSAYARHKAAFTAESWQASVGNIAAFTRDLEQSLTQRLVAQRQAFDTIEPLSPEACL